MEMRESSQYVSSSSVATLTPSGNRKVVSPIDSPALVQRLEDSGYKRQKRWMVKVIDRGSNECNVLEIGTQILNGIAALHKNKKWGKVTEYDVSINRGPKGSQPLYSVTPNPKENATAEEIAMVKAFNERVDVSKFIAPTPVEKVCELLNWNADTYSGESSETETNEDDFTFSFN